MKEKYGKTPLLQWALWCDGIHQREFKKRTLNGVDFPFILHPLEVMKELILAGEKDEEILAAAILHDTVEDEEEQYKDSLRALIKEKCGSRVLSIVDELTLPAECADGGSPTYNKNLKYEHIAKLLSKGSIEAIRVKLADRGCNIADMVLNKEYKRASKYAKQFTDCFSDEFFKKIEGDEVAHKLLPGIVSQIVDF